MTKNLHGKAHDNAQPIASFADLDPSTETGAAIRALARCAFIFRGVFIKAGEGQPIRTILEEHQATVILANEVLDKWLGMLEIDRETGEDIS
jgi:hypothetical protein